MANVASGQDVYAVSKIRTSQGRQGMAFSATLLRNKKEVAEVINEANGGCLRIYWFDRNQGNSVEDDQFNAFIEAERLRIPEPKIDEESSKIAGHDVLARTVLNADIWIEEAVNRTLDDKRFRRMCKTKTLFQVGANIGGSDFKVLKGVGPEVRAWVEKKFAGQKVRFLNDELK